MNDRFSRPDSDAFRACPQWKSPFAKTTPSAPLAPTISSDESSMKGSVAADRPDHPLPRANNACAISGSPTITGCRGPRLM